MNELLELIRKSIEETKTRANAALAGLPPVDQFQGAQEVVGLINAMKWIESDAKNLMERFSGIDAKLTSELEKAAAEKIAAELEAGTILRKTDADAAIAAAKDQVRQEEEGKVAAERARLSTITARRAELTTAHGADAAAALSDEVVAAEAFDGVKTEVGRRISELEVIGITAATKRETFAEILVEAPFTEEGKATFDKQILRIKDIAGIKPGAATFTRQPGKPGAGQPPVPAGGAPDPQQKQEKPAESTVTAAF
jgi:hypothetical protein